VPQCGQGQEPVSSLLKAAATITSVKIAGNNAMNPVSKPSTKSLAIKNTDTDADKPPVRRNPSRRPKFFDFLMTVAMRALRRPCDHTLAEARNLKVEL